MLWARQYSTLARVDFTDFAQKEQSRRGPIHAAATWKGFPQGKNFDNRRLIGIDSRTAGPPIAFGARL